MKKNLLSLFTESPNSLGINEYRMEFSDKEMEEEFKEEGYANFISKKRVGLIIGVVIFLIFGLIDYLLFSRLKGLIWFIRFAIVIPSFLAVFSLTYMDKFKPHIQKAIPAVILLMSFAHLLSLRYIPFQATASFFSGYILLIIYAFLLMRSGFKSGLLEMVLMTVFYGFFVLSNDNIEDVDKIIGMILVLCTSFIGVLYTYFAEYSDRKHFILKKRHKYNVEKFDISDFPFEEAILFIDEEGKCKYLSKQVENLIALNREDVIDKSVSRIFSANDKLRFEDSIDKKHQDEALLEECFHVVNKGGLEVPLALTATHHVDPTFGKGYIIILSNPELEYSSAKLLSNTQQLLREKTEAEAKLKGRKNLKSDLGNEGEKDAKKDDKKADKKSKKKNKTEVESTKIGGKSDKKKVEKKESESAENVAVAPTLDDKAVAEKINELEKQIKEFSIRNDSLYRDAEALRKDNTLLRAKNEKQINADSMDSIKLMGRLASFISSNLGKNFGENINYLSENRNVFYGNSSKNYIDLIENRVYQGLYLSGSIAMRFDLFEQYLKDEKSKAKGIEVSRNLSGSISQLAKYFQNTSHMVEISCKDNIMVRMDQDSFRSIFQNLVINGLIGASSLGKDALIEIVVKEEKSKLIIDYSDNGKAFPSYYKDILKLKKIDSNVLSVNGIEFFFAKDLIRRECAGELTILPTKEGNKVRMTFMK